MLDIESLPDEYAVLVAADPTEGGTAVLVTHAGELHSVVIPDGGTVSVVTYGVVVSNMLETSP